MAIADAQTRCRNIARSALGDRGSGTRVGRASGRGTNLVGAGEQAAEAVALTHELVEALTATGIYLETATRILEVETRPPGDTLGQVLEKSLTQFSRAVEAVRRLRATICP